MTGHLIDLVKTTKEATFSTNVFSVFHNDLDDSEERPSYFLASPQKPTQTKEEEEQTLNSFSSPPPMFSEPILSQDISTLFSQSQSYPLSPPQALKRTLSISDQEDENQSENPPVITTYKIKRKTVYFIILFFNYRNLLLFLLHCNLLFMYSSLLFHFFFRIIFKLMESNNIQQILFLIDLFSQANWRILWQILSVRRLFQNILFMVSHRRRMKMRILMII